jgi:hypothetical protein
VTSPVPESERECRVGACEEEVIDVFRNSLGGGRRRGTPLEVLASGVWYPFSVC